MRSMEECAPVLRNSFGFQSENSLIRTFEVAAKGSKPRRSGVRAHLLLRVWGVSTHNDSVAGAETYARRGHRKIDEYVK
jgi:hypothetical protein